jgi:hypothetical protein
MQCDGNHKEADLNKDALYCTFSDGACSWQQCPAGLRALIFVTGEMVLLTVLTGYSASLQSTPQTHHVEVPHGNFWALSGVLVECMVLKFLGAGDPMHSGQGFSGAMSRTQPEWVFVRRNRASGYTMG